MKINITIIFLLLFCARGMLAQDVHFLGSNQIKGYLNPALTGLNGSLSFTLTTKDQYIQRTDFLSAGLSIEQSFPCTKIDFGIGYIADQEGAGLLTTHHIFSNLVYTLPFELSGAVHNIRIGTKFQYTGKSIDWDRLIFSDQIHPKYNLTNELGIPNLSDFIPPAWNSASRLSLGTGFIHKADIGLVRKWSLTWGLSFENYTGIFEDKEYDSLLRLQNDKTKLINKWSFYLVPEFPLTRSYKDYFGFRPGFVLLREASLTNIQLGFDVNYRRAYGLGFYFNTGGLSEFSKDTKSIMFSSFMRVLTSRTNQLNLGIQYAHNIGGLSEVFGQTIQLSVSYIMKGDGCANTPTTRSDCPQTSRKHRLLFENIWFTPVQGINI